MFFFIPGGYLGCHIDLYHKWNIQSSFYSLKYWCRAQLYDFNTNTWNVMEILVIWGRGSGHLGFPPRGNDHIFKSYIQLYPNGWKYGYKIYNDSWINILKFFDLGAWRRPSWISENARGWNFAHPPEIITLNSYEHIPIRKMIYATFPPQMSIPLTAGLRLCQDPVTSD